MLILPFVPSGQAAGIPRPSLRAALAGTQIEDRVEYVLSLENRGGIVAVYIRIDAALPPGLTSAESGGSAVHMDLSDLAANSSTQLRFVARIDPGVAERSALSVTVDILYRAPGGTEDYTTVASSEIAVGPRGGPSPLPFVAAAAAAALLILGYAWRLRAQGVRIDQLFLLHDSGMMIRHYTNGNGLQKDGDIMSGMLIILQEFVRDSFNDPRGSLEEVRFGDRRVLMARGDHSILAAVVSGRRLNGLPAKLGRAVGEFERAQGAALASWDGNLARLDAADATFQSVLTSKYRAPAPA